jgi:DNA-binding transcriptional regulator YiaG
LAYIYLGMDEELTPEEITAVRMRFGFTLQEMSEALGIDPQTWHRWEAGTRRPPPYLWRALRDLEREYRITSKRRRT